MTDLPDGTWVISVQSVKDQVLHSRWWEASGSQARKLEGILLDMVGKPSREALVSIADLQAERGDMPPVTGMVMLDSEGNEVS